MKRFNMRKQGQKGFTLLELLIVVTLLAIIATGALVAYEGLTDTAQSASASNSTARVDQSIRNYKAVTQSYPNQWDNLVVAGAAGATTPVVATGEMGALPTWFFGGATGTTARGMATFLATMDINATNAAIRRALEASGVGDVQTRLINGLTANVEPNLQHNEGAVANTTDIAEVDIDEVDRVAVVPSFGSAACVVNNAANAATTNYPTTKVRRFNTSTNTYVNGAAIVAADGNYLNKVNDSLEPGVCHLVVALGFGKDAAQSTTGSPAAITTAPTYVSNNVNPNTTYARYIGLFHVGDDNGGVAGSTATAGDNVIANEEIFTKARLLAIVDTEGKVIDQNIAASTDETAN